MYVPLSRTHPGATRRGLGDTSGVRDLPSDYQGAVELLLARCPELKPAWDDLVELMETSDPVEVGLYNVTAQIVMPVVAYLLGDPESANLRRPDMCFTQVPERGTPEAEDFLTRLYSVLDSWAVSPDRSLNQAVFIEFAESGYRSLSVDDLVRHAGPQLQRMAGRGN